jgi:hypothetical protein
MKRLLPIIGLAFALIYCSSQTPSLPTTVPAAAEDGRVKANDFPTSAPVAVPWGPVSTTWPPTPTPKPTPTPVGSGGGGGTPTPTPTPSPTPTPTPLTKYSFSTLVPATGPTVQLDYRVEAPIAVTGLPSGQRIHRAVVHVYVTTTSDSVNRMGVELEEPAYNISHSIEGFGPVTGTQVGAGCGLGPATSFDPTATTLLSAGTPPYSGVFKSRATINGVLGLDFFPGDSGAYNGTWNMQSSFSTGAYHLNEVTIQCWAMDLYVGAP